MFELHPKWKEAWKWLQSWLAGAVTVAPLLYAQFAQLQVYLPPDWFRYGMSLLGFMMLLNIIRKKPQVTP